MSNSLPAAPARTPLSPRRLYLYALVLMLPMSLPYLALFHGFYLPFSGLLMFPVWAIDCFRMIFHESGHMITQWLFGQPSGMRFYPDAGGAVTYSGQQQPWLLALFYFEMALLGFWLHLRKKDRGFRILCALVLGHAIFAATPLHRVLGMEMGHGGEIVAGTLIAWAALFRGEHWTMPGGWVAESAWRLMWATAGVYLIWENVIQMGLKMFGTRENIVVSPFNGKRVINDIALASRVLDVPEPVMATVVFIFAIACLGFLGRQALLRAARP